MAELKMVKLPLPAPGEGRSTSIEAVRKTVKIRVKSCEGGIRAVLVRHQIPVFACLVEGAKSRDEAVAFIKAKVIDAGKVDEEIKGWYTIKKALDAKKTKAKKTVKVVEAVRA